MFTGFNASAPAMRSIVNSGIRAALPEVSSPSMPGSLEEPLWHDFLARAVHPFVSRLAPEDAGNAAQLLEERGSVFR